MMIFIKNKTLHFDVFTSESNAYNFFAIEPAIKFMPEWWKKAKPTFEVNDFVEHATIKTCTGLIDYYKTGFILPMWSDLALSLDGNSQFRWQFADNKSVAISHPHEQWASYSDNLDLGHLKIVSPWRMKGKKDIKWLLKKPYWNFKPFEKWNIAEGMVDYSIVPDLNINVFFDLTEKAVLNMSAGDPFCHLVPIADENIKLHKQLITDSEWHKLAYNQFSFTNSYRKFASMAKKCPFK